MKRVAGLVVVGVAILALAAWLTLRPARRISPSDAVNPPVAATPPDPYPEHTDVVLEAN